MVSISNWLQFSNNTFQGCISGSGWEEQNLTCLCTAFHPIISVGDTISAVDIAGNEWRITAKYENNKFIVVLNIGSTYTAQKEIAGANSNENVLMYCRHDTENSYTLAFRRLYGSAYKKEWAAGACGYNNEIEIVRKDRPSGNYQFPVGTKFEEIYGYKDSPSNLAATAVKSRNVILFMSIGRQGDSFNNATIQIPFEIANAIQTTVDPGEPIPGKDPYLDGGVSGTGGGTGTFSGTGDDVDIPSLPTLSATDTRFITIFNPSADELRNLANYMWGDLFDVSTWKKILADPMDAILGLSIVPVAVPDGGSASVTVGNISTGISMNKAGTQYVEVDCGTLNVEEYWGGYLDYDPFTKAEIYLPYIGIHPLSVDDIMGKSVHVVYHVDILSGACCAYVKCGGSVLYSFVGQCSCSIPITGNDWTNVINGTLTIAASIGTMVATGGASAPMAASAIASTAVNSMKPNVEKSGSMGGMGGMLGIQTPYLILTRPRQALPKQQNKFSGYPSFITMSLGDCSGYTEIENVHLENIAATEQELSEIESLLKGGVIL